MNPKTQRVTRQQVDQVLERVEEIDVDDANLLRAYLVQLEGQIRVYELEGDDEQALEAWAGAVK